RLHYPRPSPRSAVLPIEAVEQHQQPADRRRGYSRPPWIETAVAMKEAGSSNREIIEALGLDMGPTGLGYHLRRVGFRPRDLTFEERFWMKVERRGPDECWPWRASKVPSGYGQIGKNKQSPEGAHRVAWRLANGRPVPRGMFVRHTCDNPPCCNPAHLRIGTPADNSRDARLRRRTAFGSRNGMAKLTEHQVQTAFRRARNGESYRDIARDFGVSASAIHLAVSGKTWRHVGGRHE